MSRKRIYLFLLLILTVLFTVRNKRLFTYELVERGTVGGEFSSDWFSLISKEVNKKKVKLIVDGRAVDTGRQQVLMDTAGGFLIPVSLLTDAFGCAAHFYDETRLVVEKSRVRAELYMGKDEIVIDGQAYPHDDGLSMIDGTLYASAAAINAVLSYTQSWNVEERKLEMTSMNPEMEKLPSTYDYREVGRAPRVKNQGTLGTCWSFASLMALESRLLPEEVFDFSEDHMSRKNSFHMDQNDGGEYTMSMAYLLAWQGPVLESEDAYGDGVSPRGLAPSKHVQGIEVLPSKDYEAIKKAVFFYGGVQSSLYTSMVSGQKESGYYNKDKGAYCYMGTEKPNHDVVIIGWDDDYSKENFSVRPEGDGAFICANSWGGEFGEEGYFYVSYYDANIGIHNILYKRVDETDNYDRIYQTDLCGWVGQLGYGKENAYFANIYQSSTTEELMAVGFYATGTGTSYEVYVSSDLENVSFSNRTLVAKGNFENSGFHTVDFDTPIRLQEGQRFAVIVNITTPGSVHPVAIEYNAPDKQAKVDLTDGEGYISLLGTTWERVEEKQSCNVCLKAYTREVKESGE